MSRKVPTSRVHADDRLQPAARNGLLDRRALLTGAAAVAGTAAAAGFVGRPAKVRAQSIAAGSPPSMLVPGVPMSGYGMPAKYEADVARPFSLREGREGTGSSRTPHHLLNGTITPNGLHFERHHNGVPDIDPAQHKLLIHGLVDRPLTFTVDTLHRYPMVTRIALVECAGNSAANTRPEPPQTTAGVIHGLVSCSEWTGVPLSTLLAEAGVDQSGAWILAEGADPVGMSRSVPMAKALDDAMIALYQNGEAIRPEQGYPMRLLLPGYEGNMSVKWLRRIKVADGPTHTKDETSKYSDLMPDGVARQFTYALGVKSFITHPSFGMTMQGSGFYEVSGLAWTGHGHIARVEVSADGGTSWADAALNEPVLPMALTRFRIPWQWDGGAATLMSRATDDKGNIQPTRAVWAAQYAPRQIYHYHAIQSWRIATGGRSRMFTSRLAASALVALLAASAATAAPQLGQEATPEELAGWDISIPPDGSGLPPGSGDAVQGAAVYAEKCETCHGEGATGGLGGALAGGVGSLATEAPTKTVNSFWPYATTLFDYIRRAMPLQAPQSLTSDEIYAVSAYILSLDGIVAEDAVLDAATLPEVRMPNRDGFVGYWPPEPPSGGEVLPAAAEPAAAKEEDVPWWRRLFGR